MNEEPKAPAYSIETDRLLLRCFQPSDAIAFRALLDRNDGYLRPWIPWMKDEPMSLADTMQRLRTLRADFDLDRCFRYAIYERETLIGLAGLYSRVGPGALEIGYMLDRATSGRGYALEASAALVRAGFEIHAVERMEIHCAPENAASARIPRKLGFTLEAIHEKHSEDSEGVLRDSMQWVLQVEDYSASPARDLPIRALDATGRQIPAGSDRAGSDRTGSDLTIVSAG